MRRDASSTLTDSTTLTNALRSNLFFSIYFFFSGIFIGIIFLEKIIKIRLLINVQTVQRQMNSPQEEEIRIRTLWGVELAALP